MAIISAFSKLVLLFVTAHVTSALNSIVPVVHTVSSVTLISGNEGLLSCKYNKTVYAVYWRYESTTSPMELLIALDNYYDVDKRSGPGYDEGHFDITDDYALIIHDVQATDEGTYICEVVDYKTGLVYRNHTDVTTVVIAERPFIRIGQCEDDVSGDEINEPCVLYTTSEDRTVQLTCAVVGVKPMVDLTWESSMPSEHWKQVMNESTLTTREGGNGIFDQTLTVIVDTSYIKSNEHHFTCVAKGLAVDGMANYTIAVYPPQLVQGSNVTLAVVISVACILLLTFVIIGVMWRRKRERYKHRSQKVRTSRQTVSLNYQRSVRWRFSSPGLYRPHDIIKYGPRYIIADTYHNRLISYNPKDDSRRVFYSFNSCLPYGLAALPDSRGILVSDKRSGDVTRVKDGVNYPWVKRLNAPTGIVVHKGEVFVAEYSAHLIKVYDLDGKFLFSFGGRKCLQRPRYLAVNSKDKLYVTDVHDINVFETSGQYVDCFKISVHDDWHYRGIAIDKKDNIFVTARLHKRMWEDETITALSPEHKVLEHYTRGRSSMHYLRGLCIDYERNNLVVVDGEYHRLNFHKLYECIHPSADDDLKVSYSTLKERGHEACK